MAEGGTGGVSSRDRRRRRWCAAQWCGLITLVVGTDRGWASWAYFAVLVALIVATPVVAWLAFGRRYVDYTVVHGGIYERPRRASAWQLVKRISAIEKIHLLGNIESVWFQVTSATSYEQIGAFPKREGMAFYDAILAEAIDVGVSLETTDERAAIPRSLHEKRADLRR